jgi:hypothetical protein
VAALPGQREYVHDQGPPTPTVDRRGRLIRKPDGLQARGAELTYLLHRDFLRMRAPGPGGQAFAPSTPDAGPPTARPSVRAAPRATGGHPMAPAAPPRRRRRRQPALRLIALGIHRSCNLACKHCRAEAHEGPTPRVQHAEAKALMTTSARRGPDPDLHRGRAHAAQGLARAGALRHEPGPALRHVAQRHADHRRERADHGRGGVQRESISIDGPDAAPTTPSGACPGPSRPHAGIEYLKPPGWSSRSTHGDARLGMFKDSSSSARALRRRGTSPARAPGARGQPGRRGHQRSRVRGRAQRFYIPENHGHAAQGHLRPALPPHPSPARQAEGSRDLREIRAGHRVARCLAGWASASCSTPGRSSCGYLVWTAATCARRPSGNLEKLEIFKHSANRRVLGKSGSAIHKVCAGAGPGHTMSGDHMAEEPLCSHVPARARHEGGKS